MKYEGETNTRRNKGMTFLFSKILQIRATNIVFRFFMRTQSITISNKNTLFCEPYTLLWIKGFIDVNLKR